jgi:hypothetical protein
MHIRASAPSAQCPTWRFDPGHIASAGTMTREQAAERACASRPSRGGETGVTGDVLVRSVPFGARASYTLSEIPGPDQVRFTCLADAARVARDYARERGVDVWSDDGAGQVEQLSRFRPAVAAPSRPAGQTGTAPANVSPGADAGVDEMTGAAPAA